MLTEMYDPLSGHKLPPPPGSELARGRGPRKRSTAIMPIREERSPPWGLAFPSVSSVADCASQEEDNRASSHGDVPDRCALITGSH